MFFSNLVIGSFSQSWEAVASPTFGPVSAKLSFGQGNAARTAFDLSYQGSRVNRVHDFPERTVKET